MKWITTPSWIRRNQEGLSSESEDNKLFDDCKTWTTATDRY